MILFNKASLLLLSLVLLCGCLFMPQVPQSRVNEEKRLLVDAQKAFEDKAYTDAIRLYQDYINNYPQSKDYTIALQRLGESFEGLLDFEYRRRLENQEPEPQTRKEFLAKYGSFNCWEEGPEGLAYNKIHFKTILEKHPDSPIADEAAYHLIQWEKDYEGQPEAVLRELEALETIFEKYPTTSLRPIILYQMAHRCHILYEIYAFSSLPEVKNVQRGQEYREKALYLYQLTLNSEHTEYSKKAWENMELLQKGVRIYRF